MISSCYLTFPPAISLSGFFVAIWIAAVMFKSNDILKKQTALKVFFCFYLFLFPFNVQMGQS